MTKTICFDLRCLQMGHESRGIGMHVKNLLENLPKSNDFHYSIYAFDTNDPIRTLGIKMQAPYDIIQTPAVKKSIDSPQDFLQLTKIIWHRYTPLRSTPPMVFVQFDFMLGIPKLKQTRTVLFAYDLIPLIFKDEYLPSIRIATKQVHGTLKKTKRAIRSLYYRWRYRIHYKNFDKADLVLSISENTKKSLIDMLNINPQKIQTVPLAPSLGHDRAAYPKELPKNTSPFIFYIGGTDLRKRVIDLIKAFEIIKSKGSPLSLVLVGKEFAKVEKIPNEALKQAIATSPFRDSIYTLGYVTDSEKVWLYAHATAFVFPTAYEGFGLPVLEAMASNCPVITYDNSSISEVAGDAAVLVKTGDYSALANAIESIDDKALRQRLIAAGKKQVPKYTWEHHAKVLLDAVNRLEISSTNGH